MFPTGAPGVALLVLRCCIATALAGIAYRSGWQHVAFLGLLSLLYLGMLTPVVCGVAAAAVLLDLSRLQNPNIEELAIVLLSAFAFVFLGPGAYSIDGRLFGRRKLVSTNSPPLRKE
jgi:hypothetical protein